ncbi:hypothetical protein F4775DRAFT_598228 [Biscogniauxia sp. FL1348]|nr:hypothetical protein F4775DRAFT_598228 [Biscogniauxia sp. FL1348]
MPCTYTKPSRKRGPKPANVDRIAERVLALVSRNPELQQRIIDEILNGREPETGRPNIEIIQDPAEKTNMLATFDQCPVANLLNDYKAGKYPGQQSRLSVGPLSHGIGALNVPTQYQLPLDFGGNNMPSAGLSPAPQPGTDLIRLATASPMMQSGPATGYSLPGPSHHVNPAGYQNTAPVPHQSYGHGESQQQLPPPMEKQEPEEFKWELDISDDEDEVNGNIKELANEIRIASFSRLTRTL